MNDEVLVKVENVSKKFCRDLKRSLWYGVKDIAGEITGRNNHNRDLRPKEFWALNDISFELKRGEVLGLIGKNGAGKTTLLKVLNNLIKPDAGRVTMRGRVGALIALGAGFNPILTGRENIYVNGAVLGLTKKEIDAKFDEIVDFAELWDFIDTPVQSYSSGMQVRLGFAVATALKPDILLLDEVLAVGDRSFRIKCYNKIGTLVDNSGVVFVSHSMNDVARVCDYVAVLEQGQIIFRGNPDKGIEIYDSFASDSKDYFVKTEQGFHVDDIQLHKNVISWNEALELQVEFTSELKMDNCVVRILILDTSSIVIAECKSTNNDKSYKINKGKNVITECLRNLKPRNGNYYVNFVLSPPDYVTYLIGTHQSVSFIVKNGVYGNVSYQV